jgi:phosphatidylethanolamine/phosphatidyl-N-methylethanolamine N-methyltransferase
MSASESRTILSPHRADMQAVRAAYARIAGIYDHGFGPILEHARAAAVARVNALPGADILEVGVGTGLALPLYAAQKKITGIDVSAEMLRKARHRAAALNLSNVDALLEMDAQATGLAAQTFDVAVAMFVASVVPDARAMLAELRRVVRPGGTILLVNHFARDDGIIGWAERKFAAASARLGWHADFRLEDVLAPAEIAGAKIRPMPPFGLFRMVELPN